MSKNEAAIALRKLSQQYAYTSIQMHESIGRSLGFSGTDHKYLGFLVQKGRMTAGELSALTGLTTGAITGLIDRFVKKKLVRREADKEDRRKIIIVPDTKKIIKLFEPYYKDFQNDTDELFGRFSAKESKVLEKYFSSALQIMNEKIKTVHRKNK